MKNGSGTRENSIHGNYVEHNLEIRHPIRDESRVEPTHHARRYRENDESTESDCLTESVMKESAEESPIMRSQPVRRAWKRLKKYKSMVRKLKERVNDKVTNPKIVNSKTTTVVMSLAKVSRPNETGQGDAQGGREKENQVPPMLLAGLISSTAPKVKRNERTLADIRLEMEVISQCRSGGFDDYKSSRTIMTKVKLEGQLDVVEYSRFTRPESVHMGDPAGSYLEMVKERNTARGHLMAWHDKQAMQEYLIELIPGSNLMRKENGTVISSEANENCSELLSKMS